MSRLGSTRPRTRPQCMLVCPRSPSACQVNSSLPLLTRSRVRAASLGPTAAHQSPNPTKSFQARACALPSRLARSCQAPSHFTQVGRLSTAGTFPSDPCPSPISSTLLLHQTQVSIQHPYLSILVRPLSKRWITSTKRKTRTASQKFRRMINMQKASQAGPHFLKLLHLDLHIGPQPTCLAWH